MRIGKRRDAGLQHRGVGEQCGLDLHRVDVFTARDDQVAAPIEHAQAALCIELADVAGVQPAARERGSALRRAPAVAAHQRRPAHQDLTGKAWAERAAVLAADPQLAAGQCCEPRVEWRIAIGERARRDLRTGLREPVARRDRPAGAVCALEQWQRRSTAAEQYAAQHCRRRPLAAPFEQALEHRRHERDPADALRVERRAHALRIEALVQHCGRALERGADRDREAADVVERQAAEPTLAGLSTQVLRRCGRARGEARGRKLRALRCSAGPRGVENCDGSGIRRRRGKARGRRELGEEWLGDRSHSAPGGCALRALAGRVLCVQQEVRASIAERVQQLALAEARVQRQQRRAELLCGV